MDKKRNEIYISKKQKILWAAVIFMVVTIVFGIGIKVGAAQDKEPGSVNDPLITKSYLESYLGENGGGQAGYSKVTLKKNQLLIGKEGTEIVLYSGSANTYSTSAGLVNVSVGEISADGMTLGKYYSYLCPDSETGIKAISDTVVFVKGGYSSR